MENVEQETIKMEETRKQPSRLEVIGAIMTVGVLGFWFGVGAVLVLRWLIIWKNL